MVVEIYKFRMKIPEIYNNVTRSIALYGAETLRHREAERKRLKVWKQIHCDNFANYLNQQKEITSQTTYRFQKYHDKGERGKS